MKRTKRKVRKQSGDRASRIAGRIMGSSVLHNARRAEHVGLLGVGELVEVLTVGELKTLCASVLSQDETKGPRR